jgi:four helix bundle protein
MLRTQESTTKREFDLGDRLITFSARVISMIESLPDGKAATHIGGQILRSATAPVANHGEAQSAESRRDFVHKMKVGLKELRETTQWLKLIDKLNYFEHGQLSSLLSEIDQLERIFFSSIRTAMKNLEKEDR